MGKKYVEVVFPENVTGKRYLYGVPRRICFDEVRLGDWAMVENVNTSEPPAVFARVVGKYHANPRAEEPRKDVIGFLDVKQMNDDKRSKVLSNWFDSISLKDKEWLCELYEKAFL